MTGNCALADSRMPTTKISLLGTGFIADIHLESYRRFVPDAEVVAVYSRSRERAEAFGRKHGIGRWLRRSRSRGHRPRL